MHTPYKKGELVLKPTKSKGKSELVIVTTWETSKKGADGKVYFKKV
jgi:hypothetical protein